MTYVNWWIVSYLPTFDCYKCSYQESNGLPSHFGGSLHLCHCNSRTQLLCFLFQDSTHYQSVLGQYPDQSVYNILF